jgi:hypothetical protein
MRGFRSLRLLSSARSGFLVSLPAHSANLVNGKAFDDDRPTFGFHRQQQTGGKPRLDHRCMPAFALKPRAIESYQSLLQGIPIGEESMDRAVSQRSHQTRKQGTRAGRNKDNETLRWKD